MANYVARYETTSEDYKIGVNNVQLIPGEKGEKGDDGEDGITPIKGVDYFTQSDKEEILNQIESLTNIELESLLVG